MSVQIPSSPILETKAKDVYLEKLLAQGYSLPKLDGEIDSWLQQLRQQAQDTVASQRMPNRRDEEWRQTEIADLLATDFVKAEVTTANIDEFALAETTQSRLVFVNGVYSAELSDVSGLPAGIFVGNLSEFSNTQDASLVKYLGKQNGAEEVFTALNTASFADVAVIWVQPNTIVETPIQIIYISTGGEIPTVSYPRALVLAQRNSSLNLVEQYVGSGQYFTNAVTEIWLDENAQVQHTRLQEESTLSFQIGKTVISQGRDSRYTGYGISFGGKLSRHHWEVWQLGNQTESNLYGLDMLVGEQVADTHSAIALNHPHGTTDQLHKCIVDDRAHTVFNGKVFVPKTAQMTNANQLNRNLLLSPKARVNTKPELQITADNVKCAHGATISQLEADEIFYLRSRGLSESDSRHLLIDAFANEIIEKIPVVSLKEDLLKRVRRKTKD
jgi:Fe-S cluster assembly protein SufD